MSAGITHAPQYAPRPRTLNESTREPSVDVRPSEPQHVRPKPVPRDFTATPPPQHRLRRHAKELGDLARREEPIGHDDPPTGVQSLIGPAPNEEAFRGLLRAGPNGALAAGRPGNCGLHPSSPEGYRIRYRVALPPCPFQTLTRRHEQVYARSMFLAGVPVDDKRVLTLAAKLRDAGLDDTAERLETAYDRETAVLALLDRRTRRHPPGARRLPRRTLRAPRRAAQAAGMACARGDQPLDTQKAREGRSASRALLQLPTPSKSGRPEIYRQIDCVLEPRTRESASRLVPPFRRRDMEARRGIGSCQVTDPPPTTTGYNGGTASEGMPSVVSAPAIIKQIVCRSPACTFDDNCGPSQD